VLWFGWCAYWRRRSEGIEDTLRYRRFETAQEFWAIVDDLAKPKTVLYLVSHNTAYDFGVLRIFDHLDDADFELTSIYLGGLTVIMRFKNDLRKLCVLDNANYFQGKLAVLGAAIGYPKHDVDPLTAPLEKVDPYCKRDVEILVKLWQAYYEFIDQHDLGNWGPTIPSQAFKAFRHRFMNHKITIHADMDALALERRAYHGGRTTAFWQGSRSGETFYKLDVNSMYPFVMASEQYPHQFYALRGSLTIPELRSKLRKWLLVAHVTVNTDEPVYALKTAARLVYPVGRFDTVLTTPELTYALDHEHVEAVHEHALYKGAKIFESYVNYFYPLKNEYRGSGDGAAYLMVKLYLNSLYGKMGQRSEHWESLEGHPPELDTCWGYYESKTGYRWRVYQFGGRSWQVRDDGEARDSFPAIAAHVTAHARLYLWQLINMAGREHVFYCDTDSMIVDDVGMGHLTLMLSPFQLGALKVEAQENSIEIVCPKHYRMGNDWKRKGIPSKAINIGNDTFVCTHFPSFKTQAKVGAADVYQTQTVTKRLAGTIYDGTVQPDGWVTPLQADDLAPERRLTPEIKGHVQELRAQRDALFESLPVNAQTVFAVWDWRNGDFKRGRDKHGNLVALEYSQWDSKATELGFSDLAAFKEGVLSYLDIQDTIVKLGRQVHSLLYPSKRTETQEAIPW